MRFLVTTTSKFPMPPEVAPDLIEALGAWANRYTQSGKLETVWASAGKPAGGGVLNVDSLDELDAIMTEFPVGPFSEIFPFQVGVVLDGAWEDGDAPRRR